MKDLRCPQCGEHPAMRGGRVDAITYTPHAIDDGLTAEVTLCPHPIHAAARDVVDAAESFYTHEDDVTEEVLRERVRALLAHLEKEGGDG